MRKNLLFLFIFFFTFLFGIIDTRAQCYKLCESNKCRYDNEPFKCIYYHNDESGTQKYVVEGNDFTFDEHSSSHGLKINEVNMDICVSNLKISYEKVNDSFCDSSNNTMTSSTKYVYCGNIGKIPRKIPELTSWFITIVEIVVPVILVIMGAIDFVKAITGQKEDEIKKGQQIFIKRLITGLLIFFIIAIVKLLIGVVSSGGNESKNIVDCIECFLNNKC